MTPIRLIPALTAAAMLVAPSYALAENDQNTTAPPPSYNAGQPWQPSYGRGGDRDRDDRGDRDRGDRDRDDRGNGHHNGWGNQNFGNYGGYYGYGGGYQPNGGYGYGRNGNQLGGTVGMFYPYNLFLQNGTHVVLHDGTVIYPTGATPQPGQSVRVAGHWNGDGTFAADAIALH